MATNKPQRQRIPHSLALVKTAQWLRQRGYQAAVIPPVRGNDGGIIYSRPNEPAQLATTGQTLLWDGTSITVDTNDKPKAGTGKRERR